VRPAYYDATFLVKLYCREHGSEEVRRHSQSVSLLVSSLHSRGEIASTLHRKRSEGAMTEAAVAEVLAQFRSDVAAGVVRFQPIAAALFDRIESVFLSAPIGTFLRAADALHLACAAENGFTEIHSNDRHLLAAAPLFGLRGMNAIPGR